jgi:hypothetical protein
MTLHCSYFTILGNNNGPVGGNNANFPSGGSRYPYTNGNSAYQPQPQQQQPNLLPSFQSPVGLSQGQGSNTQQQSPYGPNGSPNNVNNGVAVPIQNKIVAPQPPAVGNSQSQVVVVAGGLPSSDVVPKSNSAVANKGASSSGQPQQQAAQAAFSTSTPVEKDGGSVVAQVMSSSSSGKTTSIGRQEQEAKMENEILVSLKSQPYSSQSVDVQMGKSCLRIM